jgi:hypothetical protein
MTHECDFCGQIFSAKSSLVYHQRKAKYCLEKRGISGTEFVCSFCDKNLTEKRLLQAHEEKCQTVSKINLRSLNKELETKLRDTETKLRHVEQQVLFTEKIVKDRDYTIRKQSKQIARLQDKLRDIAMAGVKKHSVTNKQIVNNLLMITDDHLKEQAKLLTIDHIKQGAIGYADFACQALKDRILCVDYARRKIKYRNPEGQMVIDPEMGTLTKKLFQALDEHNSSLIQQYKNELRDAIVTKYNEAGDEMTDLETLELDEVVDQIDKQIQQVSDMHGQTRQIARGEKPEMYHEFVREVCNKTV